MSQSRASVRSPPDVLVLQARLFAVGNFPGCSSPAVRLLGSSAPGMLHSRGPCRFSLARPRCCSPWHRGHPPERSGPGSCFTLPWMLQFGAPYLSVCAVFGRLWVCSFFFARQSLLFLPPASLCSVFPLSLLSPPAPRFPFPLTRSFLCPSPLPLSLAHCIPSLPSVRIPSLHFAVASLGHALLLLVPTHTLCYVLGQSDTLLFFAYLLLCSFWHVMLSRALFPAPLAHSLLCLVARTPSPSAAALALRCLRMGTHPSSRSLRTHFAMFWGTQTSTNTLFITFVRFGSLFFSACSRVHLSLPPSHALCGVLGHALKFLVSTHVLCHLFSSPRSLPASSPLSFLSLSSKFWFLGSLAPCSFHHVPSPFPLSPCLSSRTP